MDNDYRYLLEVLHNHSNALSSRYFFRLNEFVEIGEKSSLLSDKLSKAFFDRTDFVIGVTGGSATQHDFAWPHLVQRFLQDDLRLNIELRNAAQGSTSQVITSACIDQLVGSNVDLLLWEFGMNDIGNVEKTKLTSNCSSDKCVCESHPVRCAAADAWIREAIRYQPAGIGYVHLWDIGIHNYELSWDRELIPNRSWKPTNAVHRHYVSLFGSYFAIDVIRMIKDLNIFDDKRLFLRDDHHPNGDGYRVIADLFSYALLSSWIAGLTKIDVMKYPNLSLIVSYPTVLADCGIFPSRGIISHCAMSFLPQFGTFSTIRPHNTSAVKTVNHGKVDEHRADRKQIFVVEPCFRNSSVTVTQEVGGMYFDILLRRPACILLDCGLVSKDACESYSVFFNDVKILNQKHLHNATGLHVGFMSWFSWSHCFDTFDAIPLPFGYFHTLRICGASQKVWGWHSMTEYKFAEALLARIVVLEDINL